MASLGRVFKVDDTAPTDDFAPLPAGEYRMLIESAEVRDGYGGQGTELNVKLQVLDGQHKGRKVFDGITLAGSDQDRIDKDAKRVNQLGQVARVDQLSDSEQLVNKVGLAKITTWKSPTTGKIKNFVSWYKPDGGPPTATPATADYEDFAAAAAPAELPF